jgi:coenzyme F420-reducing hydrogenase beta subunit
LPPVQQMGGLYNVIVFFSVEQRDALRAEAARRGGTVTAVLREAMDEWLSEREGGS